MNAEIKLPEQVKEVMGRLEGAGFEAFVVGGCVRDSLLGKSPDDFDVATSALPMETKAASEGCRVIETGLKHGTVTVLAGGLPVEITTYRVDSDYSDNRHPDAVSFTRSLREDAARRDFTMNAVAYSDAAGIVDYFGGASDIKNGVIRCVGDADKRFREDALRIFRALRFASELGFKIEENTERALFYNRELLLNISAERIAAELAKLLCGKNAGDVLVKYIDIIGAAVPELLPMKGFEQRNPHHIYDVLTHTARAVDNVRPVPSLRLAALLHDAEKPSCFSLDENGIGHFYGHAERSAETTDALLRRLKFDNDTRQQVTALVRAHGDRIEATEKGVKRALNRLTPDIFFPLLELARADVLAQSPDGLGEKLSCYGELERIAESIVEQNECFSLKDLAINGDDVIALGVPKGKQVGELLQALLDAVINGEVPNDRAQLTEYSKTVLLA